jgi:hypothetical protein
MKNSVFALIALCSSVGMAAPVPATAPAVPLDDVQTLRAIAQEIETLKANFPQLKKFSAAKNFDEKKRAIDYDYRTHRAPHRAKGMPATRVPGDEGIWFHIDIHDVEAGGQKDAEPVILKMCFGPKKRVQFLILEGARTAPLNATLFAVLRRHGVTPCGV